MRRMDRHGFVEAGQVWEATTIDGSRLEATVLRVTAERKEVVIQLAGGRAMMKIGDFARAWTRVR